MFRPASRAALPGGQVLSQLCGGKVVDRWTADRVLAHSESGAHAIDNYRPAHGLCNSYRWSYSPEEFQRVLKIGVWARLLMEKRTALGETMLLGFFNYDRRRQARRHVRPEPPVRAGTTRSNRSTR